MHRLTWRPSRHARRDGVGRTNPARRYRRISGLLLPRLTTAPALAEVEGLWNSARKGKGDQGIVVPAWSGGVRRRPLSCPELDVREGLHCASGEIGGLQPFSTPVHLDDACGCRSRCALSSVGSGRLQLIPSRSHGPTNTRGVEWRISDQNTAASGISFDTSVGIETRWMMRS